ncbi:MAG: BatD family protein [Candidatus Omnitrophota bacterium]
MRRWILPSSALLLILLCGIASAAGNEITAYTSVDRATVLIGDRIKLTVGVKCGAGTEIAFPVFKEGRIGDFEIKDTGREDRRGLLGGALRRQWYYIAAYSAGKHHIPQLEIKYRNKGAKDWRDVKTKPLSITVESVLPNGKMPADIKDIKGPLRYFEPNLFLIAVLIVVLAAIALAVLYKLRKKPAPVKTPYEIAAQELETVRANFLKNPDVKEYYAGVSDCVRRYIERAFKFKAPEMTTEEFLDSLKTATILSFDQKNILKDFLSACDLVKFAKYLPAAGEMESVFLAARKFIDTSAQPGINPELSRRVEKTKGK